MEGKLLHSRVLSSSSKVLSCTSNPVRSHENGVQIFTPWSCSSSFKGMSLKASYSPAQFPRKGIDLVPHQTLLLEDESSMINGVNGTFLKSRSRQSFLLDAHDDEYEGIMVDSDKLPSNPQVFASMLEASLFQWKLKGKKGVWLKLPLERSELVPIAVKEGFTYHHAERGYVMLTYWIPEGPCMLPANASHQVGVGGFVINDKNEVLVVQEKHCAPAFKNDWKLPTGFILESEEIYNGVIREVKEETGIVTEFVEVIAFRHAHRVAFDKSDLLFICMLKPLTSQIVVDGQEIKAAKWMPLDEFVQSIQGDSMFKKIVRICLARLRKHYCGLSAHHVVSKFDGKTSSLYYNVVEPQDFNCRRTEDKQLFSSSNVHCMQYLGL